MMRFENVQIQLVDLPPVSAGYMEPWIPQAVRPANASVLLVDVNDLAVLESIDFIVGLLDRSRIAPPKLLVGNKIDLPGGEDNLTAKKNTHSLRSRLGFAQCVAEPQPKRT